MDVCEFTSSRFKIKNHGFILLIVLLIQAIIISGLLFLFSIVNRSMQLSALQKKYYQQQENRNAQLDFIKKKLDFFSVQCAFDIYSFYKDKHNFVMPCHGEHYDYAVRSIINGNSIAYQVVLAKTNKYGGRLLYCFFY